MKTRTLEEERGERELFVVKKVIMFEVVRE
jgi:hypothetical protein